MTQPTDLASRARFPSAPVMLGTRREARLRPEHAHLYPGVRAGVWEPAAVIADCVRASELLRGTSQGWSGRVLHERHFEFRGGEVPAGERPRREDR